MYKLEINISSFFDDDAKVTVSAGDFSKIQALQNIVDILVATDWDMAQAAEAMWEEHVEESEDDESDDESEDDESEDDDDEALTVAGITADNA